MVTEIFHDQGVLLLSHLSTFWAIDSSTSLMFAARVSVSESTMFTADFGLEDFNVLFLDHLIKGNLGNI